MISSRLDKKNISWHEYEEFVYSVTRGLVQENNDAVYVRRNYKFTLSDGARKRNMPLLDYQTDLVKKIVDQFPNEDRERLLAVVHGCTRRRMQNTLELVITRRSVPICAIECKYWIECRASRMNDFVKAVRDQMVLSDIAEARVPLFLVCNIDTEDFSPSALRLLTSSSLQHVFLPYERDSRLARNDIQDQILSKVGITPPIQHSVVEPTIPVLKVSGLEKLAFFKCPKADDQSSEITHANTTPSTTYATSTKTATKMETSGPVAISEWYKRWACTRK